MQQLDSLDGACWRKQTLSFGTSQRARARRLLGAVAQLHLTLCSSVLLRFKDALAELGGPTRCELQQQH
jgi:hypothetical protein